MYIICQTYNIISSKLVSCWLLQSDISSIASILILIDAHLVRMLFLILMNRCKYRPEIGGALYDPDGKLRPY